MRITVQGSLSEQMMDSMWVLEKLCFLCAGMHQAGLITLCTKTRINKQNPCTLPKGIDWLATRILRPGSP